MYTNHKKGVVAKIVVDKRGRIKAAMRYADGRWVFGFNCVDCRLLIAGSSLLRNAARIRDQASSFSKKWKPSNLPSLLCNLLCNLPVQTPESTTYRPTCHPTCHTLPYTFSGNRATINPVIRTLFNLAKIYQHWVIWFLQFRNNLLNWRLTI